MPYHRRFFLQSTTQFASAIACLGWSGYGIPSSHRMSSIDGLFEAILQGDLNTVKRLLRERPELVHSRDSHQRSPFTVALLERQNEMAQAIREAGYKPDLHESALALDWKHFEEEVGEENAKTEDRVNAWHPLGGTTMHAAAHGGAGTDMWRVYSVGGVPDVKLETAPTCTPLQIALRYPDLATAELTAATLLANAANPNACGTGDLPPLCIATQRGSLELVEMLIRLGATVAACSENGNTPLNIAEAQGHDAIVQILTNPELIPRTNHRSRQAQLRDGSRYVRPAMDNIAGFEQGRFVGISHFNLEQVQARLKEEPKLAHSIATTSERCVEACAHTGQKDIVKLLLEHGAPYSLPTAVMMGDTPTVEALLRQDRELIHERGAHDFPLLWYPIIGDASLEMLELLCQHGADVEDQHYLGTTTLHWACRFGRVDAVEYLLQQGADPARSGRKFNAEGQTPAQLVSGDKKQTILDMLNAHR